MTKQPATPSLHVGTVSAATGVVSEGFADTVAGTIASLVGTRVSNDVSLMSAGLDSISVTELVKSLSDIVKTDLPSTLVFDHPSVSAIVSAFAQMVSTTPAGNNTSESIPRLE